MKTLILILLSFSTILFAQGELDIKPSNVDFKDEFHRIESVTLFNKGKDILTINSIAFKQNLFFITFDKPIEFPIQIIPDDSINMDVTLTNYFTVTTADTTDTISFFTSNPVKDQNLRVRIRFFDDDEKYGTLTGQIQNNSLSVENTKIYIFRDGQYLYDSLLTDINGNFTKILPEGFYTASALKEGFYFTYYKNKFDIYDTNQFYVDHDSTTSISWKIEKILETNSVFTGNVFDYISTAAVRKGIIVVRKGKHTPTKRSAFSANLNNDFTYSTKIQTDGTFSFENIIEPGFYYIQAFPDFYTPSYANDENLPAILWQDADSVFIDNGIINKDIFVVRDSAYGAGKLNGQIFINSQPALNSDFIVFAKNDDNNTFTNYSIVDSLGNFNIINLPLGNYKLIAYQFGNFDYESEETYTIDLTNTSLNNIEINFLVNS
ncbi:MAG: hypothetical protein KDC88_04085, partial [Ignavibacteriae bacterium]|nr:hypothetical protein [Ignavibacteriota bacterium]